MGYEGIQITIVCHFYLGHYTRYMTSLLRHLPTAWRPICHLLWKKTPLLRPPGRRPRWPRLRVAPPRHSLLLPSQRDPSSAEYDLRGEWLPAPFQAGTSLWSVHGLKAPFVARVPAKRQQYGEKKVARPHAEEHHPANQESSEGEAVRINMFML